MIGNSQLGRRKIAVFGLFVISTAAFLLLYSKTDSGTYWRLPFFNSVYNDSLILAPEEEDFLPPAGFLVYSEECQIPDVDPYDPTIKRMIALQKPLDCSKLFPALTYTAGNILIIDSSTLGRFRNISTHERFICCYSALHRAGDGQTDNGIRIEDNCTIFTNGTFIKEEFIEVKCFSGNTNFYKNYHSFIHDKLWVEKRCENFTSRTPKRSPPYSIMIIGVDSVSRLNMHRQFPETLKYLKEDMDAIEMYGYNKVGDNTFPNLIPVLTGYHHTELPSVCRQSDNEPMDKCPLLWNRYRDVGYRTFYAEDTPGISTFNYLKPGFYKQPTDYYFRPLILKAERNVGWKKVLNTHFCVGSVTEAESVLQWLEKFASNFHNRSYFAMAWINSMTHDFLNFGSYVDHFHWGTLKRLHTDGSLNNTVVIFMSDHGMRWGEIRNTYIGRLEERLPTLLISFPPSFKRLYPDLVDAVRRNSHKLTTPFDLYATLENLIEFEGAALSVDSRTVPSNLLHNFTSRAQSLFREVRRNRTCRDASIVEHWCTCQKSKEVSTADNEVRRISNHLVDSINSILKPRKAICSVLRLYSVTSARLRSPADHLKATKEGDIFDYTVVIMTKPGDAIFEGTVRFAPHQQTRTLLGSISRLNIYGNQSACVSDADLRKYCYCK